MVRIKLFIIFLLFPTFLFSFSLNEGEVLIENGKLNEAASYFSDYSQSLVKVEKEESTVTSIGEYSLSNYYLAMSFYKLGASERAYDTLQLVYNSNDRKVGFNVLMGLIIISIGEMKGDDEIIKQGYSFLKKASLYEGLRLRNSFVIDKTQVVRRKRVYYLLKRLNGIDPQGKISYDYYHKLLFDYYKSKNYLSPLSVEYEKLLIVDPDKKEYYEKLFELYKELKYYDNLSFILQMFMKKFYTPKDRRLFIKYMLQKIRADLLGRNYLECEKNLEMFSLKDIDDASSEEKMEYYSISLELYTGLNIKAKLLSLLQDVRTLNEKRSSMDFDVQYIRALLFLHEDSKFYSKNEDLLNSLFQRMLSKLKKYYPNSIYTYLLIGEYYYLKGRYDSAQAIFSQMAALPKQNFDAHFTYIQFLSNMANKIYIDEKDSENFDQLNSILRQSFREIENIDNDILKNIDDNKKFELYKIIGKLYFLKGLTFGTIDKNIRGNILSKRDMNMGKALEFFEKALKINGDDTVILNYLGWTYIYKRKFSDAFNVYRLILQISPFDSNAKYQMKFIKNQLMRSY
ncbi:hypothetical protein J7L48_10195 [bacterium]|nr:hypothetical protein [bacterium]